MRVSATCSVTKVIFARQEAPVDCNRANFRALRVGAVWIAIASRSYLAVPIGVNNTPLRLQGSDAGVGISGANGIAGGAQRCEQCRSTVAHSVRIIEHHIDEVEAVVQKRNGFSGALYIAGGWCVSICTCRGDNSHSAKGPAGQSQRVREGF